MMVPRAKMASSTTPTSRIGLSSDIVFFHNYAFDFIESDTFHKKQQCQVDNRVVVIKAQWEFFLQQALSGFPEQFGIDPQGRIVNSLHFSTASFYGSGNNSKVARSPYFCSGDKQDGKHEVQDG